MLGAQVAVAVADAAGRGARLQLRRRRARNASVKRASAADPARELAVGRELEQRLDVLVQRCVQRRGRARGVARAACGVELGEPPADRDERRVGHAAVRNARRERPVLVEPAHLDDVVDGVGMVRGRERHALRGRDTALTRDTRRGASRRLSRTSSSHICAAALDGPVVDERQRTGFLSL